MRQLVLGYILSTTVQSSKITVFVLGENTILKFVRKNSMKLTLELVVNVLKDQTKFRDNLLKFTNEAFPAKETNPADFDKLEGYDSKHSYAEVAY